MQTFYIDALLVVEKTYKFGTIWGKISKVPSLITNSMNFGQFFTFHDFSMAIFIFQVSSLRGNPDILCFFLFFFVLFFYQKAHFDTV